MSRVVGPMLLALTLGLLLVAGLSPRPWQPVGHVSFSPDGSEVAAISYTRQGPLLQVLDAGTGAERPERRRSLRPPLFSPSPRGPGLDLQGGPELGSLGRWPLSTFLDGQVNGIGPLMLASSDGRILATSSRDPVDAGMIRLWDLRDGASLESLSDGDLNDAMAMSEDGSLVVAVRSRVVAWDRSRTPPARLPSAPPCCSPVAMGPGSDPVAAAQEIGGGGLALWKVRSGQRLGSIGGRSWRGVRFSRDGRALVVGGWHPLSFRPVAQVWLLDPLRLVCEFDGHAESPLRQRAEEVVSSVGWNPMGWVGVSIWSVALSPDGRRAASADSEGMVRVWDASSGHECWSRDLHGSGSRPLLMGAAAVIFVAWIVHGVARRAIERPREGAVVKEVTPAC